MNAHALLTSQGWRGSGHSLHAHSDSIGLARPLLVSQKQNTLGVGKKQHRTSDMWWMNAFDKSLQGLDTSKEGQVVQTVTGGGLDMVKRGGGKYVGTGGLYACFVRGETLVGSVKEVVEVKVLEVKVEEDEKVDKKAEKKRRKDGETKEERRERKLEKRARRAAKSSANESSSTPSDESDAVETKAQRKERRRLRKASKAEAAAAASQDSSDTRSSKDDKKKKKRKD
ncbi:hypothetical protein VC83_07533 [Pseudogymnoascus destructans]|uniref:G-patch domain-containing protein n=1 Tax=Pseudogymnoascus destructans TaxID=655981 RepID=A0A177A569_9PEZI|nr:uncharacterized protein VC83_07533 [Pseudogymnoascus destructans]OAF56104.1 hypothetical protein VC83_07533 [Pseudogymnoascus destructans]